MKISEIRDAINQKKTRSAWDKGVKEYALELLENLVPNMKYNSMDYLKADLLDGASDWRQYSWGGCSLIYNEDIAKRLSSPSELKKNKNGERRPNSREEWLDTQARALHQAATMIIRLAK